jgi:hypothetical protein
VSNIYICWGTFHDPSWNYEKFETALQMLGHMVRPTTDDPQLGRSAQDGWMSMLYSADVVLFMLSSPDGIEMAFWAYEAIGFVNALVREGHRKLIIPIYSSGSKPLESLMHISSLRIHDNLSLQEAAEHVNRAIVFNSSGTATSSPKVFISHRHADVDVAKSLVHLLECAFDIHPSELRCTSVPPYRLRAGDRTGDRIRRELQSAEAVIGLISPTAKDSAYVLFELGASWSRSGLTFPLLIKGATAADLPKPIDDLNSLSLFLPAECRQLIDDLADSVTFRRRDYTEDDLERAIAELVKISGQSGSTAREA